MTDDILEHIVTAVRERLVASEPADNVTPLNPVQRDLVEGLAAQLNYARAGHLHSFIGVCLYGDEADVTIVCHGAWQSEPYAHSGALACLQSRLAESTLEDLKGA